MDIKVELQKAKEAACVAKEVSKAAKTASYKHGVQEMKIQLADELAEVCRDYCKEVWEKALNRARVFAASEWRSAENIFYPKNIREVPTMLPPPATLPLLPLEQLSTIQAPSPDIEVSTRAGKTNNQNQGIKAAKGKEAVKGGP